MTTTTIQALKEEFERRVAIEKIRNAVRTLAKIPDKDIAYQALAKWIDLERRRRGLVFKDIADVRWQEFDYGNAAGVAMSAEFDGLDKDSSALIFITDRYEKEAKKATVERDAALKVLGKVRRKRSIRIIRKEIDKSFRMATPNV